MSLVGSLPVHLQGFCGWLIFVRSWIYFFGSHFGNSTIIIFLKKVKYTRNTCWRKTNNLQNRSPRGTIYFKVSFSLSLPLSLSLYIYIYIGRRWKYFWSENKIVKQLIEILSDGCLDPDYYNVMQDRSCFLLGFFFYFFICCCLRVGAEIQKRTGSFEKPRPLTLS